MNRIRTLIAGDTLIAREGLRSLLGRNGDLIEIIGEALVAQQIPLLACEFRVDSVVMGMTWYGDDRAGPTAIAQLRARRPGGWIVVIADDGAVALEARRAGADVVLTSHVSETELLAGIQACLWREGVGTVRARHQTDCSTWDIEAVQREIQAHKQNLHSLELQRASWGPADVPLRVTNAIRETEDQIDRLERKLSELTMEGDRA